MGWPLWPGRLALNHLFLISLQRAYEIDYEEPNNSSFFRLSAVLAFETPSRKSCHMDHFNTSRTSGWHLYSETRQRYNNKSGNLCNKIGTTRD